MKDIEDLEPLIKHFDTAGKCQSDNFKFWSEYLEMVDLLFNFLAAERDSDWKLHLETFQEMLAYDRAYDHYKYFQWGSIYLIDMLQLPETHPQLYQEFLDGNHTVSRAKSESKFNTVSTDMALEQSLNKDMKTKGGIVGFSQDYDSLEKWTLTSHLRAAVHSNFEQLVKPNSKSTMDKELSSAEVLKSEKNVQAIVETVQNHFKSPFKVGTKKQPLSNIVSGAIVKDDYRDDILEAKERGKTEVTKFIN